MCVIVHRHLPPRYMKTLLDLRTNRKVQFVSLQLIFVFCVDSMDIATVTVLLKLVSLYRNHYSRRNRVPRCPRLHSLCFVTADVDVGVEVDARKEMAGDEGTGSLPSKHSGYW